MNKKNSGYPSESVSRKVKEGKKWGLQYVKAMWDSAVVSESSFNWSSRTNDFINLRKYANGKQDMDQYKSKMFPGDQTYTNIDFSAQSPLPKLVDIMVDMILNTPYKPEVKTLDTLSSNKIDVKRKKMYAKMRLKQMNQKLKQEYNLREDPIQTDFDDAPDNEEGYKVWSMMNSKAANAIALETLVEKAFQDNEFDGTKRKVARDMVVLGTGAIRCYITNTGKIKIRYVDPVNLITSWVDNDNYSDSKHFGEVLHMNISQLRESCKGQLDEKDIFEICKSVAGPAHNNPGWEFGSKSYYDINSQDLKKLDSFKVRVLDFECIQSDDVKYVEKQLPDGRIFFDEVDLDYEPGKNSRSKKKVHSGGAISFYSGKWIIDSDKIYDWGRSKNMLRRKRNGSYEEEPLSTFCIFSPDMYDMDNTSKVELAIPSIDQIIMDQMKIQHLIMEAAPPGLSLNVGAITAGMSQLKLDGFNKPAEIRNIRKQLGDIYWSSIDEEGPVYGKPVEVLPNGLDQSVERILNIMNQRKIDLKENLGIPDGVDGTQPEERTSATVQKIASAGATAAMRNLMKSFHTIVEGAAERAGLHWVDMIDAGLHHDEIEQELGKGLLESITIQDIADGEYKFNIEILPDEGELAEFMGSVSESIQAGLLPPEDRLVLKRIAKESVDKATEYLMYKRNEFDKKKEASELKKIKAQSEGNAEAAERTAAANLKAKLQELAAEGQKDIAVTREKGKQDRETEFAKRLTAALEKEYGLEAIRIQNQGKIAQEKTKQEGTFDKDGDGKPDKMDEMVDRARKRLGKPQGKEGEYDMKNDSMPNEAGEMEPEIGSNIGKAPSPSTL